MFLKRKSHGMELSPYGVTVVELHPTGSMPLLARHARVPFPKEVLKISLREPNVVDAMPFISTVREAVNLVDHTMRRVSVSLPDSVGRVFLLEVETPFKSRDEALDLIRWKLKKSFPFPVQDVHLDFQQVERKVSGEQILLVSSVARAVILQYEDLLCEAGLEPFQIDFTAFSLYHLFLRSFRLGDRKAFISWFGSTLSIFIFSGDKLIFHRSKELPLTHFDGNRIFRELSSSLIAFKTRTGALSFQEIYCFSTHEDSEALDVIIRDATDMEPVMLDTARIINSQSAFPDPLTLSLLSSAIGAAHRVL